MAKNSVKVAQISLEVARRDFLARHLLAQDPHAPCTPARTLKLIRSLGFVQLDTITAVERAHHHILWARLHHYQPQFLDTLQRQGKLFEHFTHDASLIPIEHFPHWKHRFDRVQWSKWISSRLGSNGLDIIASVRRRVEQEGPLMASDFEDKSARRGTWWEWKPAKAALELLWRKGELAVPRRKNFQKLYDFTHRVYPDHHDLAAPPLADHIDWACTSAMSRLGIATPTEIARFWNAISIAQAREWCRQASSSGVIASVEVQTVGGKAMSAFALPTVARRTYDPQAPVDIARILSPFDPVIRDRARCSRLFGFDYRFEAFTPAPRRKYGYFVLPVLRGENLIARIDPDLDRSRGELRIRNVWFEAGRGNATDRRHLDAAIQNFAKLQQARVVRD